MPTVATVTQPKMHMVTTKAPPIILAESVNIRVGGLTLANVTIGLKPERYITRTDVDDNRVLSIQGTLKIYMEDSESSETLGTVSLIKDELLWMTPKNIFKFHDDFILAVSKEKVIELCSFVAKDELDKSWAYAVFP